MKFVVFALVSASLIFATTAIADRLPINPGLWESTTTNFNPMTGQQESQTNVECEVDNYFDPAATMEQGQGCEIVESTLEGETLTFDVSCNVEGGQMNMHGKYTSDGDNAQGVMEMEISFNGQIFNSTGTWAAKRIGDC
jgi:hypothetical protein